jgi:hypothetical protein
MRRNEGNLTPAKDPRVAHAVLEQIGAEDERERRTVSVDTVR